MATELVRTPKAESITGTSSGPILPTIIADAGEKASRRFIEFFTATIRNGNTRRAYARAVAGFLDWCQQRGLTLTGIEPVHVAAYIEQLTRDKAAPTVKQHLAAISMLFDWLTTGGIIDFNPAASVRGPKHSSKRGKTPVLTAGEARQLIDSIVPDDPAFTPTLIDLRDRALIAVMVFSFARVSAALGMQVADYYTEGRKVWFRLHEKGGKRHEVPAHHNAVDYMDAYIAAAGIAEERKSPLFRTIDRHRTLTDRQLDPRNALDMIKRRAKAAGLSEGICNHTFRATGITVFRQLGGTIEVPSASAWNTSHQLHITQNLRDAVCDQMSDQSTGKSRADLCQYAGDENLLGRSTIIDIVHQEGELLMVAQHARARAVLDRASEAQLALLGPAAADPDARTGLVDDDPPFDDSEEAEAEWEQTQAEWIATGFPGCEPAFPVAKDEPRAVDEGFVIVEPDEVKTKAQASTGRKEVWTYTAVVLVCGLRYALAEATVEGLWLQVSALLLELGVLNGARRLLVLGDGATWIRTWFESLGIPLKAMILCWWHLRKRCYEQMSSAGGPKDRRRAFEKELLGQLWEGKVESAIALLRETLEWVRNPAAVEELIAYLEKRRAYIPNYQQRQQAGLWIASTRVEKYNDWAVSARCKHQGMSWSPQGVLALAALEAARRNGELDDWRRDRALPERPLPEPIREAA